MEGDVFVEENGIYQIDCTQAVWATDQVHSEYSAARTFLCDADFIAETEDYIYLIEYKNANIPNAANPGAFNPCTQDRVDNVAKKFYDSLHYLTMHEKSKRIKYIYIVEYPNAGLTDRKLLRDKISDRLPFILQQGKPKAILDGFDVVSIAEWNANGEYSKFPLTPVQQGVAT